MSKILIVDDEPAIVAALTLRLGANGYVVSSSGDGVEGLRKARTESPDLIILDIMLPKMDGFTVCRMLKFDEKFDTIPIIMLTAKVQQVDQAQGKESGADAYMTKPFRSEELLARIKELIDKKSN
jgi:DNA-binding response OmpR family regulator